jgi:hypothetical protein
MKPAQLLLAYMRLVEKERELRDSIERVESLLESDPNIAHAEESLATAKASQQAIQLRLRDHDRDREAHRTRLRARERASVGAFLAPYGTSVPSLEQACSRVTL